MLKMPKYPDVQVTAFHAGIHRYGVDEGVMYLQAWCMRKIAVYLGQQVGDSALLPPTCYSPNTSISA